MSGGRKSAAAKAVRAAYTASMPTEEQEQIGLFNWARSMSFAIPELDLLYHVPNGGQRSSREGYFLKAAGVKSGVPDICLPVARGGYHALYIELKRLKRGRLTENQRWWIRRLQAEGIRAVICAGRETAQAEILSYLSGEIIRGDG